ncbi:FxsA family protein [Aestuariivirga sp.]|uniref:FxsA family protein n=1 Tax=Aestuariivirga sp. TaxID=2650926 RepID=UPI0039E625B0
MPLLVLLGFFLELGVMIEVGRWIGVIPVLLLIIAGFTIGGALIKQAGIGMFQRLRRPELAQGFTSRDAASHFLLMLAGLLFILPGFVSDVLGLLLLIKPLRDHLAARLMPKIEIKGAAWPQDPQSRGPVIEGEAVVIEGEILPPER